MAAPTLSAVYGNPAPSATLNTTTALSASPGTASITWVAGDLLIVVVQNGNGFNIASTPTASGLTFALLGPAANSSTNGAVCVAWSATAAGAGTAVTLSCAVTNVSASARFIFTVFRFSAHGGTAGAAGATNTTASTGSGTVAITTTQDNSAIVYGCTDWAGQTPGASPAYSTATAGAYTTEQLNVPGGSASVDSNDFAAFCGVYADSGTAGAKTVGVTSNAGIMRPSTFVVEVKGTGGAPSVTLAKERRVNRARFRAATW
jgi:hypothetical protein